MTTEAPVYQFDNVEVSPSACQVLRAGKPLPLEPKAFRVLIFLIENRSRAVAKDELIRVVWEGAAVTDNALTRIIAQLRRELGDDARQPRYIQTLPTLGYRFVAHLTVVDPPALPTPARRGRFGAFALAVSVLFIGSTTLWWRAHPRVAAGPIPLRPVQVTTSPTLDASGSFSPNSKSIVYSSDRSGTPELYVRPVASGGREIQLTADGRQNVEPAWSPDGNWIAYHSAARHGIWIVPAAGGSPRQVSSFGSSPAWSPDSSQLVFRSQEPYSFAIFDLAGASESTIWTVGADGTRLRQITTPANPQGRHASPSWSPDGKQILFVSLWTTGGIWTVEVASGALRRIPTGEVPFQGFPVYAPDGRGFYFAGPSRWGGFSIYYVRLDGSAPVELHEGGEGLPLRLAISPDGRKVLYSRSWSVSQIWQSGGDQPAKALYRDMVVRARLPVFSPDGKRLAYVVQRQGSRDELWTMNADGTGAASVAAAPGPQGGPLWNADGSAILFSYREAGITQLRRLDPRDGSQRVLLQSREGVGQPHVTADERDVIYAAGNPPNLWKRALAGGPPRQITFDREGSSFPSLSPDGNWIAYEFQKGNTTQIKIIDRDGGNQQLLTDDAAINWANSWSSDNRRIAYAAYHDAAWNIWWIDRVTRERKQITHHTAFGSFTRNPAWKPGSEQIVYEHWLIQGNLFLANLDPL
jgi:Tol biopolymer transport system component/DNA-binding winged helix-turn-helix (wHTH) protein